MFGLAARSFICKITQSSDHRGTGTIFPAKRTSNGLSDLVELHFVAGKLSQSLGREQLRGRELLREIDQFLYDNDEEIFRDEMVAP